MKPESLQQINSQGWRQRFTEVQSGDIRDLRDRAARYVLKRSLTLEEQAAIIEVRGSDGGRSTLKLDGGCLYFHDVCEDGSELETLISGGRGLAFIKQCSGSTDFEIRYIGDDQPALE